MSAAGSSSESFDSPTTPPAPTPLPASAPPPAAPSPLTTTSPPVAIPSAANLPATPAAGSGDTDGHLQLPVSTRIFLREDMATTVLAPFASGVVGVVSSRCPQKPTPNEDAAAVVHQSFERGVLVVADGVGGLRGGDRASEIAVARLKQAVADLRSPDDSMRGAILNGIENANREIIELGLGAATTLAVIEVDGARVRPYHVGDSMILVVGQRGRIKWQTVPHSPVGLAVEAGFLDEHEAMNHEERHLVSNIVGSNDMRIEIGPVLSLAPRDSVLMASDGLFDNLRLDEIVARVRKGPLMRVVDQLCGDARQRMLNGQADQPSKPDDATLVVYRPSIHRSDRPHLNGDGQSVPHE